MCEPKEPCYFVKREQLNWPEIERYGFWKGEDRYLELFREAGDAKVIGESSTLYTKAPQIDGVPERIARFNPEARFIYIMRDPVERAISHYWHEVRLGHERRDIAQAILRSSIYFNVSNYAMQLNAFFKYFDRSRIRMLTFEELISDTEAVLEDLYCWLGVDPTHQAPNRRERYNVRPDEVRRIKGNGWLHRLRYTRFWNVASRLVPKQIREFGVALSERCLRPEEFDPVEARHILRKSLRHEVDSLCTLLGRSFPEWKTLHNHEVVGQGGQAITAASN